MNEKLIDRRSELKRKILPLEWDKKLRQINFARDMELKSYITELESIEKQIAGEEDVKVL